VRRIGEQAFFGNQLTLDFDTFFTAKT